MTGDHWDAEAGFVGNPAPQARSDVVDDIVSPFRWWCNRIIGLLVPIILFVALALN